MKSGYAQIMGIASTDKKGSAQENNSESGIFRFDPLVFPYLQE